MRHRTLEKGLMHRRMQCETRSQVNQGSGEGVCKPHSTEPVSAEFAKRLSAMRRRTLDFL